jgi:hypothetical protein
LAIELAENAIFVAPSDDILIHATANRRDREVVGTEPDGGANRAVCLGLERTKGERRQEHELKHP